MYVIKLCYIEKVHKETYENYLPLVAASALLELFKQANITFKNLAMLTDTMKKVWKAIAKF